MEKPPLPPRKNSSKTVIIVVLLATFAALGFCCCPALLLPAIQAAKESSNRMQCVNNVKQIALAMHNYHTQNGSLPPAYVTNEAGQPLYSWRVLLLPWLGRDDLFARFDTTKAWDSPENIAVSETIVPVFQCPTSPRGSGPLTDYAVLVGPNTLFPGEQPLSFGDIRDGMSNTIMVVEVRDSGIHWAEPRDIAVEDLLAAGINGHDDSGCGSHHPGGMNTTFADGSVHFIAENVDPKVLQAFTTPNGGEAVTMP